MFRQPQTIPTTKSTTSSSSSSEPPKEVNFVTLAEGLQEFTAAIYNAKLQSAGGGGEVEAPRVVIEHYNQGDMLKGFDQVGYFIYDNVKVYEKGKPKKDKEAVA